MDAGEVEKNINELIEIYNKSINRFFNVLCITWPFTYIMYKAVICIPVELRFKEYVYRSAFVYVLWKFSIFHSLQYKIRNIPSQDENGRGCITS